MEQAKTTKKNDAVTLRLHLKSVNYTLICVQSKKLVRYSMVRQIEDNVIITNFFFRFYKSHVYEVVITFTRD